MTQPKRVSSLMARDVESVGPEAPVSQLRQLFAERSLHHVPVVDGERLIGLVSVTDLLRAGIDPSRRAGVPESDLRARHVMLARDSIVTASDHMTIHDAAAMLSEGSFHALPVVDGDDRLLGIVTTTDLVSYLVELLEHDRSARSSHEPRA